MSYDHYEHSRSALELVELYLFRFGTEPDAYLALTDAETPIEFDPGDGPGEITFDPVPIQRSETKAKARLGQNSLTVETPKFTPLGQKYSLFPPTSVVTLRIWSGHSMHADAPPLWATGQQFAATWAGRVFEVVRTKGTVKLTCDPSGASMKRPGLRRNFQRSCPHILYGPGCRADKEAATVTATLATVGMTRLTFEPGWNTTGFDDEKFIAGLVEWPGEHGTEVRLILSLPAPNTVLLTGPTLLLQPADTVSVVLGCNHTIDDCENVHNNVVNFGGHPWIPKKNPVNKNNHG